MNTRLWKIILAVLVYGFLPAVSRGEPITIGLTGKVSIINDLSNRFGGQIHLKDKVTATYSYESTTLDSNPSDPAIGDYWHYTAPYGISVHIGDFVFETNENNVRFLVEIVNDQSGDSYLVRSESNICSTAVLVDTIYWALADYGGTALLSDALPTTMPNLDDWNNMNVLSISGPSREAPFWIAVEVTSTVLVPEPATLLLLACGFILFKRR